MTHNAQLFFEAIRTRHLISCVYDGCLRVGKPCILGVATSGNVLTRVWQVSGGSVSGKVPDWKTMIVAKVANLRILDEVFFDYPPKYNPINDPLFKEVWIKI